ncbi:MAG: pilus assembly protein [Actinobacteria bacterium]|nr:pilus assembly protein [Actinomycetota bacterium]
MRIKGVGKRLQRQDGAAAVEFALIVGVLSLLVFGMMEYGLFFLQSQTLKAGTREGARQAAVGADLTKVKQAVSDGSAGAISPTSSAITMTGPDPGSPSSGCDGNSTLGNEVTVNIDTGTGSTYPAGLSSATIQSFQIDIPFMPHLDLHPTLSGTFRCEL